MLDRLGEFRVQISFEHVMHRIKEHDDDGVDQHECYTEISIDQQSIHITDKIDKWISNTYKKYGVNVFAFCNDWLMYFTQTPDLWEKPRKIRNHQCDSLLEKNTISLSNWMFWDYDYKPDGERFGLNTLYRNMPKKDFTKGKKQAFEAVMMYFYSDSYVNDGKLWEEYLAQLKKYDN